MSCTETSSLKISWSELSEIPKKWSLEILDLPLKSTFQSICSKDAVLRGMLHHKLPTLRLEKDWHPSATSSHWELFSTFSFAERPFSTAQTATKFTQKTKKWNSIWTVKNTNQLTKKQWSSSERCSWKILSKESQPAKQFKAITSGKFANTTSWSTLQSPEAPRAWACATSSKKEWHPFVKDWNLRSETELDWTLFSLNKVNFSNFCDLYFFRVLFYSGVWSILDFIHEEWIKGKS